MSLSLTQRNAVLRTMASLLDANRDELLRINAIEMRNYDGGDIAMKERLKVDEKKIDEMILSLVQLEALEDPLGVERLHVVHPNGMTISNRTAAFGTVFIIYESRPDVTIEAGGIAFKSGNKILLKGGKEAAQSNLFLVSLWHKALQTCGESPDWVEYLNYSREETQAFLEKPTQKVDVIVPRGGESLIAFVKQHATCPVIVSGRGNNFLYVHPEADTDMALDIILNAKTAKISACNALDKVLIDTHLPNFEQFVLALLDRLHSHHVEVIVDASLAGYPNTSVLQDEGIWYEEFLALKIVVGTVDSLQEAITNINTYGGGHSAAIITANEHAAQQFMDGVDTAAVYHNASTRFTDGGQFGLGGELAISTDKLHQRGPIGLQHLVTNKWYVHGNGQIR